MRVSDKTWDIKQPTAELMAVFPKPKFTIYGIPDGQKVVDALSKMYNVPSCIVLPKPAEDHTIARYIHKGHFYSTWKILAKDFPKLFDDNGLVITSTILVKSRAHAKSVMHEFYHHLDYETNGAYDSSDKFPSETGHGWIFAEKMWNVIRAVRNGGQTVL